MNKKRILAIVFTLGLLIAFSLPVTVAAATYDVYEGQSIQAAVDGASSGDVIIVHPGTYNQSVGFGPDRSGITLIGYGAILNGPGPDEGVGIGLSGASNVVIEGFQIHNYNHGIAGDNLSGSLIKNNVLSGEFWGGIAFSHSSNNQIIGNTISGCALDSIWFGEGSTLNLIQSNTISDSYAGIILDMSSSNDVIENTITESTGEGEDQGPGIFVGHGANFNVVSGNTVSTYGDGIALGNAQGNEVLNNTTFDSAFSGIHLATDGTEIGPVNNLISDNSIIGASQGISLENALDNRVTNNTIGPVGNGIILGLDYLGSSSSANLISGNVIDPAIGAGIILDQAQGNTIVGNTIRTIIAEGIGLWASTENTIESNDISAGGAGIILGDSNFNDLFDNHIHNTGQSGISLNHSSDNVLFDNEVVGGSSGGIAIRSGSNNNLILDNKISDMRLSGIFIVDANYNTIVENKISNMGNGITINSANGTIVKENKITDANMNASGRRGMGILLNSSTNSEVEENKVTDCEKYGIAANGSINNTIIENKVSDSGDLDLFDDSYPPSLANTWENNKYSTSNWD
jgi:parallel beta-helix repeat protein